MKIHIKKICVATDFSPAGEHALNYGVTLAEHHQAELHLLHILQDVETLVQHPDMTASNVVATEYYRQMEMTARNQMEVLGEGKWWETLKVERSVRHGYPPAEICRYCEKYEIDLLVLGTHGRRGWHRWLMGSVTERVVRSSPCPVLVVRPKEHEFVTPD